VIEQQEVLREFYGRLRPDLDGDLMAVCLFRFFQSMENKGLVLPSIAIEINMRLLELCSRYVDPKRWAATHLRLASAYLLTQDGCHEKNMNAVICCSKRALEVFAREDCEIPWATAKLYLGQAYVLRHVPGQEIDDATAAIACLVQVLELLPRSMDRGLWQKTHVGVGLAFLRRHKYGKDTSGIDLAQAIDSFKQALTMKEEMSAAAEFLLADACRLQADLSKPTRCRPDDTRLEASSANLAGLEYAAWMCSKGVAPLAGAALQQLLAQTYDTLSDGRMADLTLRCRERARKTLGLYNALEEG
jgi:tetratricopeptide (TPR) repeat protein